MEFICCFVVKFEHNRQDLRNIRLLAGTYLATLVIWKLLKELLWSLKRLHLAAYQTTHVRQCQPECTGP